MGIDAPILSKLTQEQREELIIRINARFASNMARHSGIKWAEVKTRLDVAPDKLLSLYQMEATGGEPDVIGFDKGTGEYIFCDCSKETPEGRRNTCYDHAAWEARKQNRPATSAMDMAASMGIEMLTVEEYHKLQELGEFDTKTSSWVKTPEDVRRLGGALFCDRRYGRVFTYHNGAESYYGVRGFRGSLRI